MPEEYKYRCQTLREPSGFTLLEVLLSVTIAALVMTGVYGAFSVAMEAWRTSIDAGDGLHHADFIADQLVMGLRSAYYPDDFGREGRSDGQYGLMLSDGGEGYDAQDTISWCKLGTSLVGANSGLAETPHRISVTVTEGDEEEPGGFVIRAWRLFGQDDEFDPAEDVIPIIIAPQVVGLDFRVRDPMSPDDEIEWFVGDEWEDTNRIPPQVEFSLYLASPNKDDDPIEVKRIVDMPMSALSFMAISPTAPVTTGRGRRGAAGGRGGASGGNRGDKRPPSGSGGGRPTKSPGSNPGVRF